MDDADGMTDGDAGDGFTTLIQRSWTLGPGLESHYCRRQTVTQDMYITGLRPVSPDGTHHEILTIAPDATKLGNYDCNGGELVTQTPMPMLFAGGIGTTDFLFPAGVAVKIPAGTTLQLYIHATNTTDTTATVTSGVQIKTVPANEVVHEADMMFIGKRTFTIPSQMPAQSYSLTTDCGAPVDWHIVGLWPHMHQYGTHQKIEVQRAAVTMKTPLDVAYDVNEQRNYAMDFMVPTNDRIAVTCTWLNDSGMQLMSNDSTSAEMCYTGAFVWPKVNDLYFCLNN
jgi:hypothetical protein